jgi:hypothetical protein
MVGATLKPSDKNVRVRHPAREDELDWSKLKSSPDGVFDCYPTTVTLLGLVPSVIELAVSRSNAIDSALEQLVATIVGEVQSLG